MKLTGRLLDLVFPRKCVFCHTILEEDEDRVCDICAETVPVSDRSYTAQNLDESIVFCYAPLTYEGIVRDSLRRFKFGGNSFYADTYAELICSVLSREQLPCDVITWAPLARGRLRKRGYDQAGLIAQAVSERLGVTCVRTLKKTSNIRAQSLIRDAAARSKNVSGVYKAVNQEYIRGKRILLVDDIVTTGATLSECARTLYGAGAASVGAVAAAHR